MRIYAPGAGKTTNDMYKHRQHGDEENNGCIHFPLTTVDDNLIVYYAQALGLGNWGRVEGGSEVFGFRDRVCMVVETC